MSAGLRGAMSRIELVIFDCDGVLIDSEVISAEVLVEVLAPKGIAIDTDQVYRNFTGKSFPKVAEILAESFQRDLGPGFESEYRTALFKAFSVRLHPTTGLLEMLAELGCRKCVATSSTPARLARSLDLTGLDQLFNAHLFTASQVSRGKPAPDLFLLAARDMGVDPAGCLVIEDSEVGLTAGLAAGMRTWRYTGGAHLGAACPPLPEEMSEVQCFDNWDLFYQMAPELRRRDPSDGQKRR